MFWAIIMLILMIWNEIFFFMSHFDLAFLLLAIGCAVMAFLDLCEYSDEINEKRTEYIEVYEKSEKKNG